MADEPTTEVGPTADCPSCSRDLSYPAQPGHVCYTAIDAARTAGHVAGFDEGYEEALKSTQDTSPSDLKRDWQLEDYLASMDQRGGTIYTPEFQAGFRHALEMHRAYRNEERDEWAADCTRRDLATRQRPLL